MKKKFEKKLSLNKKTIANLQNEEMRSLKGGSLIAIHCDYDTKNCTKEVFICAAETGVKTSVKN